MRLGLSSSTVSSSATRPRTRLTTAELSIASHAGHARMLLGRRAYVGLSRDAAQQLAYRRAGDHDGVAVFIPPAEEARRRRERRARGGRA